MSSLRFAVAAGLLLYSGATLAALPSRPIGPVLDLTGTLNQSEQAELDGICRSLESTGKGVLVVAIVPSLEGDSIEGYAVRLFKKWGIGNKDRNDGVLLLVSTGDRKVRIETGYGVEEILPDGRCGEIIRREIIPKFRAGDPGGGILAGAREVSTALQGKSSVHRETDDAPERPDWLPLAIAALFIAFSIMRLFLQRRRGRGFSGGWGGWGIGGGFGGGGGGGSFGGFGGGFSGGGGSSGSW